MKKSQLIGCLLVTLLAGKTINTFAAIDYWDPEGAVAAPTTSQLTGTWTSSSVNWSASSSGGSLVSLPSTTAACFCSGTTAPSGSFTVTVSGTVSCAGIFNGPFNPPGFKVTLSGGTINLGSGTPGVCAAGSDGDPLVVNSVLAGTGQVIIEGTDQITLNGANTYSGGTSIGLSSVYPNYFASIVNFNNSASFGPGTITLTTYGNGSAFAAEGTTAFTIANNFTVGSSPAGGLTNNFVGNTAGITYSGTWTLGANRLYFETGGTAGNIDIISGVISGSDGFVVADAGTLKLSGANTYTGNTGIISPAVLTIGGTGSGGSLGSGSSYAGNITNGGTFNYSSTASQTLSGVISGTGPLNQTSGTLILSGANTYTGVNTLSGGTLQADHGESAGTSGPLGESADANAGNIVLSGGTLQYSSANSHDYSGRFSTAASQQYNIDVNGRPITYATALTSSSGELTLSDTAGGGTLTLSAANTYTGGTTINGGTLSVNTIADSGTSAVGTSGALNLAGGTLSYSGSSAATTARTVNGSTTTSVIALPSGNLTLNGGPTSIGSFTVTKTGSGTLTLGGSADNSFLAMNVNAGTVVLNKASASGVHALGGASTVNSGGTLQLSGTGGQQIYTGTTLTVASGGVFDLNGITETTMSTLTLSGTGISSGGALINSSGTAASITPSGITLAANSSIGGSGNITLPSAIGGSGMSLTYVGTGTLTLSGVNTYSGGTTVSAGTLTMSGSGTLGATSGSLTVNGGILNLNSVNQTVGAVTISSGTIEGGTLTGSSYALQGGTVSANLGAGTVTVTSGTTTLSGTEAGTTVNINSGTLTLGNASVLSSSATVNLAGGTLAMSTFNNTVKELQSNGAELAPGTWGASGSGATHISSSITGTGILTVTTGGSSTTTLSSSSNPSGYGDSVTITATVTGTASGNSSTPSGTVMFHNGGTAVGTGTLSGSGTTASATVALSGALAVGTYSITASWPGDNNYGSSSSGTLSQQVSVVNAFDDECNDSMANGNNGGTGFAPWTGLSGGDYYQGGAISGETGCSFSWGMYSSGATTTSAQRPFTNSGTLSVGQIITVDMQNGGVNSGGSEGLSLYNSSGATVFELYFSGGASVWTIHDNSGTPASTIPYAGSGCRVFFTLTSSTTYSLTAQVPIGGTTYGPFTGTLISASPQAISQLRFYTYNIGGGNNLEVGQIGAGCPDAISFTGQPQSQTVPPSDLASFSVQTTGDLVTYQWQVNKGSGFVNVVNNTDGTGGTSATFTTVSTISGMNGYQYQCVITDACGNTATSSACTLTVTGAAPAITTQPQPQTICSGSGATFTVAASGSPLSYAWYKHANAGWSSAWSATGSGTIFLGSSTDNDNGNPDCISFSGNGDINTPSGNSWGLDGGTTGESASRTFPAALASGQIFQIDMDNGFVNTGLNVGFSLHNSANADLLSFFFTGNGSDYVYFDSTGNHTTGVGFTLTGLRIQVVVGTGNPASYVLLITPCGGSTVSYSGTFATTGTPDIVVLYNNNTSGTGNNYHAYFNSMYAGAAYDNADNYVASGNWGGFDKGDTTPISGATSASYSTSTGNNGDLYYAIAYNAVGDAASTNALLTVNPLPTVSVNSPAICAGGSATLTATTSATSPSYLWSPGGATNASITVSPASTTTYTVTVTDGTTGCTNSGSGTVTVNPLPTVSVNSATVCAGSPATLTATTGASSPSYLWSPGGATTASITVSPASTTTYTVTVTDGSTDCTNSGSGTVTVNPLPTVTVNSATVCAGSPATLTATTGASSPSYLWSDSETTASITVSPASTTTYTVTVTDGSTGCTNSGSGTVTVNPLPTITLGASPVLAYYSSTNASLPYSATTGSPDGYSIAYDSTAQAAGFSNVALTSLPASPITLTIPIAAGTNAYNGTLTVNYSVTGCTSTNYAFTVTITNALSTNVLSSSANPAGSGTNVTFTATLSALAPSTAVPGGTVQFLIDGAPFGSPVTLTNGIATSGGTNSLSRGYHTNEADYAGDGANIVGSTNTLIELIDTPPVAGVASFSRPWNLGLIIAISDLLTNATNVYGDTSTDFSLVAVCTNSTNGATIYTNATYVFYSPPATNGNVTDAFGYTMADTYGLTSSNLVVVIMQPENNGPSVNITGISTNGNGTVTIGFAGIPEFCYLVQAATNLNPPITWTTLSTNMAGSDGLFNYTDTNASNYNTRYYRTATPQN